MQDIGLSYLNFRRNVKINFNNVVSIILRHNLKSSEIGPISRELKGNKVSLLVIRPRYEEQCGIFSPR